MSNNITDYICPACHDSFDMPTCWRGAPIGAELVRLHIDVCEAVDTMVYVLLEQLEAWLHSRCDFTRRTPAGVVYRCKNTGCTGRHFMVRSDA